MDDKSLDLALNKLVQLFPRAEWNVELAVFWRKMLAPYRAEDVDLAIERHRATSDRVEPVPAKVQFELNAIIGSRKLSTPRPDDELIVEFIRRACPRPDYAKLDDTAVIMAHISDCWGRVLNDPSIPERIKQSSRRMAYNWCIQALLQIRRSEKDAVAIARDVVGLADGESITAPVLTTAIGQVVPKADFGDRRQALKMLAQAIAEEEEGEG